MKSVHGFVFFILALILAGCGTQSSDKISDEKMDPVPMREAKGIRMWQKDGIFRVEIRNPRDTNRLLAKYILSPDAKESSGDTIAVPVKSAALNSTTFAAFFDKLGLADRVTGITFADKVMNRNLRSEIDAGKVSEITSGGSLDFEKVLKLRPGVFMTYSFADSDFDRISDQGIPVVLNMEYLESTPLGRAEWIKLAGALTGRFAKACAVYDTVSNDYNSLTRKLTGVENKPSVFTGSRYQNTWFAPGRESYIAHYITDAGGTYVFDSVEGAGSTEIDFEVALKAISDADYWGLLVSHPGRFTLRDLRTEDNAYSEFNSFRPDRIFVCNTSRSDYFGDAVMEPEVVLADIAAVLHADMFPEHRFVYFHPIGD